MEEWKKRGTRLLSRADVAALLSLEECIGAVESAFRAHALGTTLGTGVLGLHVDGGGFHIKIAGLGGERPVFATKVNGNFSGNEQWSLPRIQGLIVLCDARHGYPLAVMDSTLITQLRTAAASAVAARYLARADVSTVTVAGCGLQGRIQIEALAVVRPIARVLAYDVDTARAAAFAREMQVRLRRPVEVARDLATATRLSDVIITCTPAQRPILHVGDVRAGAFVAAVGADSDTKQEIDVELMRSSAVVTDLTDQCATIGDLHHAIVAGTLTRDSVRAELGHVVAGLSAGRMSEEEVVIFDSTGTALQDVAAAAIVYQRAVSLGRGTACDLLGGSVSPHMSPAFRTAM